MKNVILYIAVSLDGYIADCQKSVNWIKGQDDSVEMQDTYSTFFTTVDTIIMGKTTYDQIITELSPDKWPYLGAKTYVFTHKQITNTEDIIFTSDNPCQLVKTIKQEEGKNIWVCGGADIINQLLKEDLIDTFQISIIPTVLGGGIRLFKETNTMINLRLVNTVKYNGVIEAIYKQR